MVFGKDHADPEAKTEVPEVRLTTTSPHFSRVCELLEWRKPDGGWKEVSCRVALLRMQRDGWLTLPPPKRVLVNQRLQPAPPPGYLGWEDAPEATITHSRRFAQQSANTTSYAYLANGGLPPTMTHVRI